MGEPVGAQGIGDTVPAPVIVVAVGDPWRAVGVGDSGELVIGVVAVDGGNAPSVDAPFRQAVGVVAILHEALLGVVFADQAVFVVVFEAGRIAVGIGEMRQVAVGVVFVVDEPHPRLVLAYSALHLVVSIIDGAAVPVGDKVHGARAATGVAVRLESAVWVGGAEGLC